MMPYLAARYRCVRSGLPVVSVIHSRPGAALLGCASEPPILAPADQGGRCAEPDGLVTGELDGPLTVKLGGQVSPCLPLVGHPTQQATASAAVFGGLDEGFSTTAMVSRPASRHYRVGRSTRPRSLTKSHAAGAPHRPNSPIAHHQDHDRPGRRSCHRPPHRSVQVTEHLNGFARHG